MLSAAGAGSGGDPPAGAATQRRPGPEPDLRPVPVCAPAGAAAVRAAARGRAAARAVAAVRAGVRRPLCAAPGAHRCRGAARRHAGGGDELERAPGRAVGPGAPGAAVPARGRAHPGGDHLAPVDGR